jgi:hypothetical protein
MAKIVNPNHSLATAQGGLPSLQQLPLSPSLRWTGNGVDEWFDLGQLSQSAGDVTFGLQYSGLGS